MEQIRGAPDKIVDTLVESVYPQLVRDPDGQASPYAPVVFAGGFYVLTFRGDQGMRGLVRYQVLQDERLVMLFEYELLV